MQLMKREEIVKGAVTADTDALLGVTTCATSVSDQTILLDIALSLDVTSAKSVDTSSMNVCRGRSHMTSG